MHYHETTGDLFAVDESYVLVHCISADAKMGAGIAVEFSRRYPALREYVKRLRPNVGQAVFYDSYYDGGPQPPTTSPEVFNLVTKQFYYDKPTYTSLRAALADMRCQVEEMGITKLAMPLIGCGLDRLEWELVRPIIEGMFGEVDVEVLVVKR